MKQLIFLVSALLIFHLSTYAQTFENLYDARSEALGRTIAVSGQAGTMYGNPATSLEQGKKAVNIGGQNRFMVSDVQFIHTGFLAVKGTQQFGVGAQFLGNNTFSRWSIQGQYSRKLLEHLDAGIRLKTNQVSIEGYGNRFGLDADLGIQSKINKKIRLGAVVQNLLRFNVAEQEQSGTTIRLGMQYIPSQKVRILTEIQQEFAQPLSVNAGVEYLPNTSLRCRIGMRSNPIMPSFGVGYVLKSKFVLDAFGTYHQVLGLSSGINLSYYW